MTHVGPSPGDSGDESFDVWAKAIDFQQSSDHIDSLIVSHWAGFTVFFKKPEYMMEKRGRYDAGPPLPDKRTRPNHFPQPQSLPRQR